MGSKTGIEWTDATWNPVTGCSKVSAGCTNCYAERMATRLAGRAGYPAENPFAVTLHPERLEEPSHWRKPRRVFVCSMSDLFHPEVPDEFVGEVFNVAAACPQHTFQILTKRPERMASLLFGVLRNVWLGTSVEDQATADVRIPHLLRCPAAVRFVSYEPALAPVDLKAAGWEMGLIVRSPAVHWVIAGGESGPRARPAHPDWFRSVRDQCAAAGVPFFFKQVGEWAWFYRDDSSPLRGRQQYLNFDGGQGFHGVGCVKVCRVGKRASGHLLDGVEHREWPEVDR